MSLCRLIVPIMNFETYTTSGRLLFEELAATVGEILKSAVKRTTGLHLQQVQTRAKEPGSLLRKILAAGGSPDGDVDTMAKDLAGCRLIFYTNSDVNRFGSSGLLTDNFEVDWDRTKIHHPTPGTETAERLFMSLNYVVRLKPDRTALPEYSQLAGLWCEVQVQTSLNHLWSEMEHDMVYKPQELSGFGGKLMKEIEARLQSIMRDHLIPAGYEFQKVVSDFDRLSNGKELFDGDALKAIQESVDVNDLHDLLERFKSYVLPNYDDLPSVQGDIRSTVLIAARQVRGMTESPIDTPFGGIPGHRVLQVIALCCDVLDRLRYLDVDAVVHTFDAICELYAAAHDDVERKRILESAGRLAENNLDIWKAAGPLVQHLLVKRAAGLGPEHLRGVRPVILAILRRALEPELRRVSSSYNAVTWEHAAPVASTALSEMRSAAITLLQRLYGESESDSERREVLHVFERATALPNRGMYSDELVETVFSNAADIVQFLAGRADKQSFEILQTIEHDFLWLHRRTRALPPALQAKGGVVEQQQRLTRAIEDFRRRTEGNRDFLVYKTLVGFESVFEPDWESDLTPSQQKAYRRQKIKELIDEVRPDNADDWLKTISRCAETRSDDLATFPSLMSFLQQLAERSPEIIIGYTAHLSDRLGRFLPVMLLGLEASVSKARVSALISEWIDQDKHLESIALYLNMSSEPQPHALARVLQAAMRLADEPVILRCIGASAQQAKSGDPAFKSNVFIPAVRFLSQRSDTRWVDEIEYRTDTGLLADLSDEDAELIFSSLVARKSIDSATEQLLATLATRHASRVIRYFGARLPFEPDDDTTKYEAIPFQLHELKDALQPHAAEAIRVSLEWFRADNEFFTYRGGRFIHAAYPSLTPEVQRALAAVVASGQQDDMQFVADVLQNYNGVPETHDLYKSIIEALEPTDPIVAQIDSSLDATGVVSGEFGFVEAYKGKKQETEQWLTDPRPRVQAFAKRRLLSLDRQIAADQRRGEESIELRKREYGVREGA